MNKSIKKKGNRKKKFELQSKEKIKILEKKPQKGGTPAIENRDIINIFEKKLNEPKSIKAYKVLHSVWIY